MQVFRKFYLFRYKYADHISHKLLHVNLNKYIEYKSEIKISKSI